MADDDVRIESRKPRGDNTLAITQYRSRPVEVRPKLRLVVLQGGDLGKAVTCPDRILHIGTQEGNALQLDDDAVSRIHLQIRNSPDKGIAVRDLSSTNGTWLPGGVRISEAVIPPGTVVELGHSQVRIDVLEEKVSESLSSQPGFGLMIGVSPAMRSIFARMERVAPTDETVLITGETGTGKELCARSIVGASRRIGGPLEIVDCGAMPPSLLESELFGHVRGAFTDAKSDYQGAFERANGGTVFLDEIGELPLEMQTRLLRAVENREVRRIGGSESIPLDFRIVAATNRLLEEEVNRGTFRADLYYRLSVVQFRIPPLRDRPEDIEPLARSLMSDLGLPGPFAIKPEQVEQMKRYRWPGNVRELRNYLRRLTLGEASEPGTATAAVSGGGVSDVDLSLSFKAAKEAAVGRFERAYLAALLDKTKGNISEAARQAQTDRTYLSRLLNKYNIPRK
jgi:DNA-binding NtrC family response regulator